MYHAAVSSQAASLSLTAHSLRGLFWACQIESQKNAGFLARVERDQHEERLLGSSACMLLLRLFKGGSFIGLAMPPQSKDDPDPYIGKCSYGYGVAFAFSSFALVIVGCPRFAQGGLPSKLMKRVAQRLDTAQTSMSLAVHAALEQHRRGSAQSLQAACVLIPIAVITDFCQQSWSQTLACTRQTGKDLMIRMGQKN